MATRIRVKKQWVPALIAIVLALPPTPASAAPRTLVTHDCLHAKRAEFPI